MANVPDMHVETLETLKDSVVKLLVSKHDFEVEEAEDLAKYLATEDDDD